MTLHSFANSDSDEARQFLLDRRCERLHPKRHRTTQRKKGISAKKRSKFSHHIASQKQKATRYIAKVREYWAGNGCHPGDF